MKVISTEKIPIKLWLDDIEDGALAQAKNLANYLLLLSGFQLCQTLIKDMVCLLVE